MGNDVGVGDGGERNLENGGKRDTEGGSNQPQAHGAVFHCVDVGLNETRVQTVSPGVADKMIFKPLGDAYPNFPRWWWKRVSGTKFYRARSDCKKSKKAKDILPIRTSGAIKTRYITFRINIKEHYTLWAVIFLVLVAMVFTLSATLCILPMWLRDHPGDLQNATVLAVFAIGVLSILSSFAVSLFSVQMTKS
ncbi:uncharacterized protein BDR25DRAFT_310326 [Lindgomyces ingoldianus]|uniref:Uncharacterized protein n=1 Tax=Lindgomyces ingoldianus TaxID=673940 RepID=A0ACB6R9B2_9PLEO|nr:uncharacterized protein BDR25DRAFT_310326 [Lindgomyces ingoldianus]KAF2475873.1 hypothetical protein BDR25DRAFT_310326 [Lindgomyces ingoldianus]